MVLLHLKGGLGNQMFEYAAGIALATHLGVEFKLDKSYYDNKEYEGDALTQFYDIPYFRDILNNFETNAKTATPQEANQYQPGFIGKVIDRLTPRQFRTVYRETPYIFDPKFFKLRKNVLLKGYFQSEKYFKNYADVVRKQLTFNKQVRDRDINVANQIQQQTSVSIHVRRGDYVKNPTASQILGSMQMDYFLKAKTIIEETLAGPVNYFIFSDDIEWTKTQFNEWGNVIYIDKSFGNTEVDDMYLMSCCHHNIIANSSFSWWGAWLNSNPNKLVVAPKKWFNQPGIDTKDILPEEWITI